jgi:molecular chaperone Hsp33
MRNGGLLNAVQNVLHDLNLELHENALALEWKCRCSVERSLASLVYFSAAERQEMIEAGGQEVICHWCGTKYQISPEQIHSLEA